MTARLRSDAHEARPLVQALVQAARELENSIERLVGAAAGSAPDVQPILHDWVPELCAAPAPSSAHRTATATPAGREASDRAAIERVPAECNGNRAAAAARLGISRITLWRRLGRRQD